VFNPPGTMTEKLFNVFITDEILINKIVIDLKKCFTLSCFIIVSGNDCGNDSNN